MSYSCIRGYTFATAVLCIRWRQESLVLNPARNVPSAMNLEKLRAWSFYRQGFSGMEPAIINRLCGVYSPHPSGPLALFARIPDFSPDDFRALDTSKSVLRINAMRGSVHMIPTDMVPVIWSVCTDPPETGRWDRHYFHPKNGMPRESYPAWLEAVKPLLNEPIEAKALQKATSIP